MDYADIVQHLDLSPETNRRHFVCSSTGKAFIRTKELYFNCRKDGSLFSENTTEVERTVVCFPYSGISLTENR